MHNPLKKLLANVSYGLTIRLVDPWPNVGINSGYFININISISNIIIIIIIIHKKIINREKKLNIIFNYILR